jgi:hypothetical protein
MLDFLKKQWGLLAEISAWIITVIGGFWRETPTGSPESTTHTKSFGQFFLTLAVGLMVIPAFRFRQRQHTIWWTLPAALLLALAPVAYFTYEHFATFWTCPYAGHRIVVGADSSLTEHGKAYKAEHPDFTVEQVVWEHAGNVTEIWNSSAIDSRSLILSILYVLFLPLFAAAIICVTQAVYCGTQ